MMLFQVLRMFDLNALCEFSRIHCVAICAVLVPANLLATSQTLLMVWFRRPLMQVWLMAGVASLYTLVLVLHVLTWFLAGVVMIPTYVLLWLGSTCLVSNVLAIAYVHSSGNSQQQELLKKIESPVKSCYEAVMASDPTLMN